MDGTTTDVGEVLEVDGPAAVLHLPSHSERSGEERAAFARHLRLEPYGKLTKLTLTHEDFEDGSVILDGISKGWPAILSSLKSMLESGTALAIPPSCLASRECHEHRQLQAGDRLHIYIGSTPAKVWQALTSAEFSRKYFSALRSRPS